ncbi:ester cyclase [Candidatus Bipolaricaulota bacterium]
MSKAMGVLLLGVLAIGVVGFGQAAVIPRSVDGTLLFDNETGAESIRLGILFDGPVTVCSNDVVAVGGEAVTRLDFGPRMAWIDVVVVPGGTLQVSFSGDAQVHSAYWVSSDLEKNKVLARWIAETVWNRGDLGVLEGLLAPSFVLHDVAMIGDLVGIEGYTWFASAGRMGIPDGVFTIHDVFAEDDLVVLRLERNGTQTGTLMNIPPTGASVSERAIVIYRISDGLIAEGWMEYDALGLLVQLGQAPAMGPPLFSWDASSEVTGGIGDPEENLAIARGIPKAWNERNVALLDEVLSPDYVWHGASMTLDLDGYKGYMSQVLAAFPDFRVSFVRTAAEADMVGASCTITGTHLVDFMGIPATGVQVTFTGMILHRLADGKVVESWELSDTYGMLVQLGVIPPPGD